MKDSQIPDLGVQAEMTAVEIEQRSTLAIEKSKSLLTSHLCSLPFAISPPPEILTTVQGAVQMPPSPKRLALTI